jgi:hypothetical protein
MKFWFHHGHGEWQFEVLVWRLQVRIGSHQQAAWWYKNRARRDYVWLFNLGKRARA